MKKAVPEDTARALPGIAARSLRVDGAGALLCGVALNGSGSSARPCWLGLAAGADGGMTAADCCGASAAGARAEIGADGAVVRLFDWCDFRSRYSDSEIIRSPCRQLPEA